LIGVIAKPTQQVVVEEFFQLFKTPWEFYRPGQAYDVVIATAEEIPEVKTGLLLLYGATAKNIDRNLGVVGGQVWEDGKLFASDTSFPTYGKTLTFEPASAGVPCVMRGTLPAGLRIEKPDSITIRLGYDLFEETAFLLTSGQPVENAEIPTLDIHIEQLRAWILEAGQSLLEIPATPAGYRFVVCLTHDIDFVGMRDHFFDHSMFGFGYRAVVGSVRNFLRRRLTFGQVIENWKAVASLPFVFAGWARDFWEPFDWYLETEKDLPATYFLIPFKRRAGSKVDSPNASRRATAYDIGDLKESTSRLLAHDCELGVHGIDSWHDSNKGREELGRTRAVTGALSIGIRMHWLLRDATTPRVLEDAGYYYDSTFGYNDTVGYRAGTGQVFRPLGTEKLLELPLHIQDGALFFPDKLDLSEQQAEQRCQPLIDAAIRLGGVLTLLWHDRSHAPERFWGGFYRRLIAQLKTLNAWFASGSQAVGWFEKRRQVRFERAQSSEGPTSRVLYEGEKIVPPLNVRFYSASWNVSATAARAFVDMPWDGISADGAEWQTTEFRSRPPEASPCSS
jgi:hypothetical protein